MRDIPASMWEIWRSGNYLGDRAPMTRVTIQVPQVREYTAFGTIVRNPTFNVTNLPRELPNVAKVEIQRDIKSDAATATLTFYNTKPLPLGATPSGAELDQPGYYTPTRGTSQFSSRWNQQPNEWQDMLVPDRVLRTYQGYGFTPGVPPEKDIRLVQTGEWYIDNVSLNARGDIVCKCRDRAGPALVDQICFPPVIPLSLYPVEFTQYHDVANAPLIIPESDKWTTVGMAYDADSNFPWTGYNKAIYGGHNGSDAFDNNPATYWLSIGNSGPRTGWAFEYVQGRVRGSSVSAVRFKPWAGNYVVYVSVRVGTHWQGSNVVPYDPHSAPAAPNGANIPYVLQTTCGYEGETRIVLPQTYTNVTAVRITFTNLSNSGLGVWPYRAGVREFNAEVETYTPAQSIDQGTHIEGNYGDYTDIVKKLLAWGGFWWPQDGALTLSDGSTTTYSYGRPIRVSGDHQAFYRRIGGPDPVISGRLWADLEQSGTAGINTLTVDVWDKKPLMDGINYVKDILGFIFFVDEEGAAVFRSPNIWKLGNFTQTRSSDNRAYTAYIPDIDEKVTLMDLQVGLSKRNSRHRVYIGNTDGVTGAVVDGREPYPVGWLRQAIWTDQNFATVAECVRMAELISLRQLFTFREDTVTIKANPALQIDDQVRLYERVTGEGFVHYINGYSTTFEMATRVWNQTLNTHWLGERPFEKWVFDPATLSPETQDFLKAQGHL